MTIEAGLTQLQVDVAELADTSQSLAKSVTSSLAEIDAVKGDIQNTHNFVDSNYQAMNDWQTKHGTVTFKNLQGQNKQVNTLSKLILDSEKINPNPHVMSKAQFDALRELRKQQYAGSGFAEWGKQFPDSATAVDHINQGLFTDTARANILVMGDSTSESIGDSLSGSAISIVNGAAHNIKTHGEWSNNFVDRFAIPFPDAPDGTKTYDSATGVVTEYASAAEAFNERKDTIPIVGANVVWDAATNTATSQTTSPHGLSFSIGKPTGVVKLIAVVESSGNRTIELRDDTGTLGNAPLITSTTLSAGKVTSIEIEYTATTTGVYFRLPSSQVGQTLKLHSLQVLTSTESVITSRKDLVFLESWHEKISDKDVVYPLGNVQYGGTTFDGMTMDLSPSGIAQGYSAFGEWDTAINGRGHRWTTLIDSEKKKFIDNPENNIYYDSEADELIQVRYRIRVVEGKGDNWGRVTSATSNTMQYSLNVNDFVVFRGSSTNSRDYFISGTGNRVFYGNTRNDGAVSGEPSLWTEGLGGVIYEGKAISIALVQRMNQGAYHPTYNPMGCKGFWNSNGASSWRHDWYVDVAKTPSSTADCFSSGSTNAVGATTPPFTVDGIIRTDGSIAAGLSARSGPYKFYDAIYAGQVEDLRLNANKLDVNQLREETMRKAVAGEMRGKGKVPFTHHVSRTLLGSGDHSIKLYQYDDLFAASPYALMDIVLYGIKQGQTIRVYNADDMSKYFEGVFNNFIGTSYAYFSVTYNNGMPDRGTGLNLITVIETELSPEFDSLPWVDIVGDPERIAATFPDGVVGQWNTFSADNIVTSVRLSRKSENTCHILRQLSAGGVWDTPSCTVDLVENKAVHTNPFITTGIYLISYESRSNFTESSTNSVVVGDVGDVSYMGYYTTDRGNRLAPSLTGDIITSNNFPSHGQCALTDFTTLADKVDSGSQSPVHAPLRITTPDNNSPAVKALSTVTEKDGLLYLQLHGAELKYTPRTIADMTVINAGSPTGVITKGHVYLFQGFDNSLINRPMIALVNNAGTTWNANSYNGFTLNDLGEIITNTGTTYSTLRAFESRWGDDQVIPIVNGEDVKTDLNGNTVKVFCHHTQIPLGIASN
ncbi:hypothetical protein BGP78_06420 [Pseudoalteromonas sp. MSK9-3]|uniref:hypothetical protein n=1 Tax=Pseudoalteromonas sp. MSK9-3 TaxID=1897633 RepID=UPI000E6C14F0|nr:hypothetical protein [Pseudoalteromonas sp. MSK9-3]RJE78141.1 hypothetical protein BGP78_06420 [Pseudoalteromonas sp. MSK9-3]